MKKKVTWLFLFIFSLCGCGMFQIQENKKDVMAKIIGRRVGYHLAQRYPIVAMAITPFAESVLTENSASALETIKDILLKNIEEPMLRADINDLISLIEVKDPGMPEISETAKIAIKAMLKGIRIVLPNQEGVEV